MSGDDSRTSMEMLAWVLPYSICVLAGLAIALW
ncbi:hypothetical protein EV676_10671 [Caldimonas thermodepolymerans]|uniref:Uncharacterized protein n=1 Tax=Caldimonas thermodepolymerans TaxID=215580 RepID=A0AA46HVK0_9BURK|nr:hypothetical protein EV676_10671 [Caldimonas thermodepolymerans]